MPASTPEPRPPHSRLSRARDATAGGVRSAWDRREWIHERGPQLAVLWGVLFFVLGVVLFAEVFDAVQDDEDLALLDTPVLDALVAARSDALTAFMTAVSTVTGPVVLPIVVVVAAVLWGAVGHQWWQAALLAGAMIASTVISVALKSGVGRARPPVDTMAIPGYETTYSFPSGHTIGTATFLLVVAYLAWVRRPTVKRLLLWLLVVVLGVLLVALSRLYLGYHFVTDVVASMGLAVAMLGGVVALDRRRAAHAAARQASDEDLGDEPPGGGRQGGRRPRQDSNLRPAD